MSYVHVQFNEWLHTAFLSKQCLNTSALKAHLWALRSHVMFNVGLDYWFNMHLILINSIFKTLVAPSLYRVGWKFIQLTHTHFCFPSITMMSFKLNVDSKMDVYFIIRYLNCMWQCFTLQWNVFEFYELMLMLLEFEWKPPQWTAAITFIL